MYSQSGARQGHRGSVLGWGNGRQRGVFIMLYDVIAIIDSICELSNLTNGLFNSSVQEPANLGSIDVIIRYRPGTSILGSKYSVTGTLTAPGENIYV